MGLMPRRSGKVRFSGEDISRLQPFEIARLGMGFSPEDRRMFADLTVMENLDIGRQPPRRFSDGRRRRNGPKSGCPRCSPISAKWPTGPAADMSGGEQQMLTVARTLMGNPFLVLLDEPSEGVAPVIVEQMANTILELKREGCRFCCPSRTCTSPSWSPTARTSWKKVRCVGTARWRRSPKTPTRSARCSGCECEPILAREPIENLVLRSLRSRRLEGQPQAAVFGAILRDARKSALLRMRSRGMYYRPRHGSAAASSTNAQHPSPSGAGNGATRQPGRRMKAMPPASRHAAVAASERTAMP